MTPPRAKLVDRSEFEAAARNFPEVQLDRRVLEEYVRERSQPSGGGDTLSPPTQLAALYLCCACVRGHQAACLAFRTKYLGVVRQAIARIGGDRQFVDEVSAQLFDRMLVGPSPRLKRYSGRGDLGAWLKVVATRLALDVKRSQPQQDEEPLPSTISIVASMSPESMIFCRNHAQDILDALGTATATLDVKQRNVLRLHYADGLNIDEIGELYGVHRATVARWLQNARSMIDSAVHRELGVRHGLGASEVASLIHGARGQLEEDLRRLLSKPGTDGDVIDDPPPDE